MKNFFKKKEEVSEQETEEEVLPQESKGKKIANTVINILLVFAIIVAAFCTYTSYIGTSGNGVPSIFGIRILSIQTESMYPTLAPGDMIFDTGIKDTSELEIGDVITYWTVINGERVLNTHRIYNIYDGGGYLIFETKGDNNTVSDSLTVHESEIIGQWKGTKISGLGKVFDYLQTSTGFLIVVVIPVAIFFIYHLIQFFRVLFEYNNVKNKLLYEQERGKAEDLVEEERSRMEDTRKAERARLEAELREKLRAELLASSAPAAQETPKEETKEEMEARIRAEMEAEAKKKAEEEARAAAEAEIRAKLAAEMAAKEEPKAEEPKAEEPEKEVAEVPAETPEEATAEESADASAEEEKKAEEGTEPKAQA